MPTQSPPPHIRAEGSVPQMMWTVVLALLPALILSIVFFKFQALRIFAVSLATATLTEICAKKFFKKEGKLYDGSTVVTALLFALLLPPHLSSWMVALGSFFAIFFGREIFGGLGQNPFNPALVGYVFLVVAFPLALHFSAETVQGTAPKLLLRTVSSSLVGKSAAALLLGGAFLLWQRLIHWEIPILYLGTFFLFSLALGHESAEEIFSGSLFLGSFFLVTDPGTTPLSRRGERWFAFGAGFLTALIHQWIFLSEGIAYSILIMNSLNPWLDRLLRPKLIAKTHA